jgi:hypothetical protein
MRVEHHAPACGVLRRWDETELAAELARRAALGDRAPWACDEVMEHCTCWRRRQVAQSTGVPMPRLVRDTLARQVGGASNLSYMGLTESSTTTLACSYEQKNFAEHGRRIWGRDPHSMTDDERRALGADIADPSSTHWVQHDPAAASGKAYPESEAEAYLSEVARNAALRHAAG